MCGQDHSFIQQILLTAYDMQGMVLGAEDMKIYHVGVWRAGAFASRNWQYSDIRDIKQTFVNV